MVDKLSNFTEFPPGDICVARVTVSSFCICPVRVTNTGTPPTLSLMTSFVTDRDTSATAVV